MTSSMVSDLHTMLSWYIKIAFSAVKESEFTGNIKFCLSPFVVNGWQSCFKCEQIPYYLDEDNKWALDVNELQRALNAARPHCLPRGIVVINPGNPTGMLYAAIAGSHAFAGFFFSWALCSLTLSSLHHIAFVEIRISLCEYRLASYQLNIKIFEISVQRQM